MSLLRRRRMLGLLLACGMLCVVVRGANAQAPKSETVPVAMLSDIHFDPFHDPAKFEKLRAAPISEWQKILAEPDSATQLADATKLAAGCGTRGVDTPWVLLESSLAAAQTRLAHPLFVTVSGDLLAHAFECRFQTLAHKAPAEEQSAFAAKTLDYVASELRRTFPSVPIYMALGNNDAGCGDYNDSPNSPFLKDAAEIFGGELESPAAQKGLLQSFPAGGDYSVALPKPIVRGRLIVLQDIFLAAGHLGCDGKPDPAAATAQLEWLRAELGAAHARNEQVWVMAHIPPGVNFYSTMSGKQDVCKGAPPTMFLHNEKLVDVLTDFAPDIRLTIFAHTHMDEMRLLQTGTAVATPDAEAAIKPAWVAAKLVPSISPINGNNPSFTLADIDPKTATMKDYRVFSADNKTGIAAKWSEGYRYSVAYHSTGFTPAEVARLMEKFGADKTGEGPESQEYESNFMPGGGLKSLAIRLVWPQYVCSLRQNTAAGFRDCVCPATPEGAK